MQGKKARQLARVVTTRWLSFGDALELIMDQWAVLTVYFQDEVQRGGADVYAVRQLSDLYNPKNKVVMKFVLEQITELNIVNKAFQSEQPDQSALLRHLKALYFGVLSRVIASEGVRHAKEYRDPLAFEFEPYRLKPSEIHFG